MRHCVDYGPADLRREAGEGGAGVCDALRLVVSLIILREWTAHGARDSYYSSYLLLGTRNDHFMRRQVPAKRNVPSS